MYVVGSKEMAVLSMGPVDDGSSGGAQGVVSLRSTSSLLTSTFSITSLLPWLFLTHAF